MTELRCKVDGHNAVIVGYGPGPRGVPKAIVIVSGELKAVKLKHIELLGLPDDLRPKPKLKIADSSGSGSGFA